MICSSENLLLRIVRLLSGGYGLYPNLEEIEGLRSDKSNLEDPHFSDDDLAAYRDFSMCLTSSLIGIDVECEYINEVETVIGKLEAVYEGSMLEEYTHYIAVARCFLKKGSLKGNQKSNMIPVSAVRNFLRLLKSAEKERRRIIIANVLSRLNGVSRFQDDEIPF